MSRADREREMGLDAWDEWTPEEVANINKSRPSWDQFKPSIIPGVQIIRDARPPKGSIP
jgi:hypothetical protein